MSLRGGPVTGWRRYLPSDDGPQVTDGELAVFVLCMLVTTIGLAGDISRHLLDPASLSNDFISGWHLVLYGGVTAVGAWIGIGVIRRGPGYVSAAPTATIGFGLLCFGGVADAAWHGAFGAEVAVEALVSPPHLVVFTGLMFLLTSPIVVLWKRHARRLGTLASAAVLVSLVSSIQVTSLFTGFLTPLAGGLSLQAGYIEPLVGESLQDYDQIRGLGIALWTVAIVVAGFTVVLVRFRLLPGTVLASFILIALPAIVISGHGIMPLVAGFGVAGLVTEILVMLMGSPTLKRVGASVTGAAIGATLWATTFAALRVDDRLAWNQSLWGGTVLLSALVGAAVAALVALPVPTGETIIETVIGPRAA